MICKNKAKKKFHQKCKIFGNTYTSVAGEEEWSSKYNVT